MNPETQIRILLPDDKDALLAWSRARAEVEIGDPVERELQSWTARWRPEALEHYLGMGWSYGCFDQHRPCGFLMAQPVLFYRGHTQTLWVEHLAADNVEIARRLLETAYRWARDKHIQCLYFENEPMVEQSLSGLESLRRPGGPTIELRSTR